MPHGRSTSAERAAPCRELPWDSRFFGFRVARAIGSTLDEGAAARIDDWCEAHAVRCLYLLSEAGDGETFRVALEAGYRAVDVRLTLRHELNGLRDQDPGIPIREAGAADIPALSDLARRSHHDSRFYHDPGFSRERCDALYATWIEDGIRDPGRWAHTAEVDGAPIGYALFSPPDAQNVSRLELIAVEESHRRRGIARRLLGAGLRRSTSAGAVAMESATQERNPVSLEAHLASGFACVRRETWHHKWYER